MIRKVVNYIKYKFFGETNRRRREFLKYYKHTEDPDIRDMNTYLRKHRTFQMMNCELKIDYDTLPIEAEVDKDNGYPYVLHKGKKLYFPSNNDIEETKQIYKALLMEQDVNSPHRYLTEEDIRKFEQYKRGGYIRVFEFGAAEGMFSLRLCDIADEIHLFECESEWAQALSHTFFPYRDKVKIINKYVTDFSDECHISLDDYVQNSVSGGLDIVKMDIEGAEILALQGMKKFMKEASAFILYVCTYHKRHDESKVREICKEYSITANEGYFAFFADPEWGGVSDLRRCVLKVEKQHGE